MTFHRAIWTIAGQLCRPEPTAYDIVNSSLLSNDKGSNIIAQNNLEQIIKLYGSNPFSYPLPIFITYMNIIDKWS